MIGQALVIREAASFLCNLGMAFSHLGRHEEAVRACERAVRLRPAYPKALVNLGVALERWADRPKLRKPIVGP